MARGIAHMRVMVIVHGKSELHMCESIGSNLRITQKVVSEKKGKSSIQITGLRNYLNKYPFVSSRDFQKAYDNINFKSGKPHEFRLFTIMDVDDCSGQQRSEYIDKTMFKDHWLYHHIVPIYNDPNLEKTMLDCCNIEVKKKGDYAKIFPTNHGDLDFKMAQDLLRDLKDCPCTNLDLYLEYCLEIAEERLIKNKC